MFSWGLPGAGRKYATSGLILLLLLGSAAKVWAKPLRPGTEVFAVNADLVREVSWHTPVMQLTAQRRLGGEPFTLRVKEKNQAAPAVCRAGKGFAAVLAQLTSLKLRRTLTAREAEDYSRKIPLASWAELVIRDATALEPFQARVCPLPGSTTEALVHFADVTYIVDFPRNIFHLIAGGCRTLGVPGASGGK